MTLDKKSCLVEIAKIYCRELRKNQTPAERKLWEAVRNRKIGGKKFNRQHPIFHDISGRETFFIADFYCHTDHLIIELDGEIHQYSIKKDMERDKILNLLGINVFRFTNYEVENNISSIIRQLNNFKPDIKI